MDIKILLENTKKDALFETEHGLSAYISACGKNILLDTGQSDNFLKNAKTMGIDIATVDFAVISHFHYDHSGGLKYFMDANKKAKIYMSSSAFDEYYVKDDDEMRFFGLSKSDFDMDRFVFVDDFVKLSNGISIIAKLGYTFDNPLNDKFYKIVDGEYVKDDFSHEIAIVIEENEEAVLLSGCFHSGVVNAIKRSNSLGFKIKKVLGGFHLSGSNGIAGDKYFEVLTEFLEDNDIKCYTGHCSGEYYLGELGVRLGDKTAALYTGAKYVI